MISRCVIMCDECALRFYVCSIFVDRVFVLFIFHHGVQRTYKCFAYVAPRGWIWVWRGLCGFGDIGGSVGRYDPRGIKATGFAVTTKINHYAAVTTCSSHGTTQQKETLHHINPHHARPHHTTFHRTAPGCAPLCGPRCAPECAPQCSPQCDPWCAPPCAPPCAPRCARQMPHDVPHDVPHSVPHCEPHDVPWDVPHHVPHHVPQDVPHHVVKYL